MNEEKVISEVFKHQNPKEMRTELKPVFTFLENYHRFYSRDPKAANAQKAIHINRAARFIRIFEKDLKNVSKFLRTETSVLIADRLRMQIDVLKKLVIEMSKDFIEGDVIRIELLPLLEDLKALSSDIHRAMSSTYQNAR